MLTNYFFPNSAAPKYESKRLKIKNKESQLKSLNHSLSKLSATSVLFGGCIICFSLFQHMFFSQSETLTEMIKAIFWENGFWSFIIGLQILTFMFYSNFYYNDWNIFCTGIFLSNIITFSCLSGLSFYSIFSFIITPDIVKTHLSLYSIFGCSMNLIFVSLQFSYIFLKVSQFKNIKLEPYIPLLLPGFAVMIEYVEQRLKDLIAEKLLLNKKISKKRSTQLIESFKKDDDLLFSIE